MSRLASVAALLAGAGCATLLFIAGAITTRDPVTVECSVNDDLVFVAPGVTRWSERAGTVSFRSEGRKLVRRMEANETCSEVQP